MEKEVISDGAYWGSYNPTVRYQFVEVATRCALSPTVSSSRAIDGREAAVTDGKHLDPEHEPYTRSSMLVQVRHPRGKERVIYHY